MPAVKKIAVGASAKPVSSSSESAAKAAGNGKSPSPARPVTVANPGRKKIVPSSPEARKAATAKRKRLSKAFSRPLDKVLMKEKKVRDSFSMPEAEYAQLGALKARLLAQGVSAKKSELVRAALLLLAEQEDDALRKLLARLSRAG
jgi:hypothetical protein